MPLGSGQMGCKLLIAAAEALCKAEECRVSPQQVGMEGFLAQAGGYIRLRFNLLPCTHPRLAFEQAGGPRRRSERLKASKTCR